MNQILVSKKLYITPELKRKKKMYKINLIVSIFIVVSLISLYIYAEYDRNKTQQVSQQILQNIEETKDNTTVKKDNALVVILSDTTINGVEEEKTENKSSKENQDKENQEILNINGYNYKTIGTVNIPKIRVTHPILDGETDSVKETEELLKIAPTKFWGPDFNKEWGKGPNKQGNLVIVGHNYRNGQFFSDVPSLTNGDIIEITDVKGNTVKYSIYDKYSVDPTDVSSTSQNTNGRREITLITCTNDNVERIIVKARAI